MALSSQAADFGQHVFNFLTQNGYPVAPYTTGVKPYPDPPGVTTNAVAFATPGEVNWTPQYVAALESLAKRLGKRGRLRPGQLGTASNALHEGIHQMRYGRTPSVNSGDRNTPGTGAYWEEAATDAAAADLLPIFAAKMFGHRVPSLDDAPLAYGDHVTNLRQLSVFGSGAKNYKGYKARVWRRQFSHADAETRQRMADEAMQKRIVWGQRTGR